MENEPTDNELKEFCHHDARLARIWLGSRWVRSSRVAREDLGLEYRQSVLCGAGPARTGWWKEPYGPTGGGREYCGRSAAQACRHYLVGLYLDRATSDAQGAQGAS